MFLWIFRRWRGWNYAHVVETSHESLDFSGLIALLLMFVCELCAWIFLRNNHWIEFSGIMALGLLLIVEYVVWRLGKRLRELYRIEAAEKDAKHKAELGKLHADAAESAMTTQFAVADMAVRTLSPQAREYLKFVLAKYAGQKFWVIVPSFGDDEANGFAQEIGSSLTDCGWVGPVFHNLPAAQQWVHIHSGVGVWHDFADMELSVETQKNLREASAQLFGALHNIGVATAGLLRENHGQPYVPIPKETIEIVVGPKPKPGEIRPVPVPAPL